MRKELNRFSIVGMFALACLFSAPVNTQAGTSRAAQQPAPAMTDATLSTGNTARAEELDSLTDRTAEATKGDLTGLTAPNFILPALDGRQIALHELRGNIVVMSFWATWCPPCRRELPMLELIHQKLADRGVVVLGINTEDKATARAYVDSKGYGFQTVVDETGEAGRLYNVEALPTLLVLDRQGKVVAHFVGTPEPQALVYALISAGVKSTR